MGFVAETLSYISAKNPIEGDSNFGAEGFWHPDDGQFHRRDVRSMSGFPEDCPDNVIVIKREEDSYSQNISEVLNYIESRERGSHMFPRVYGGTVNGEHLVVEHLVNEVDDWDDVEIHNDYEEWSETSTDMQGNTSVEWGFRGNKMCPVDYGTMEPVNGYQHVPKELIEQDISLKEIFGTLGIESEITSQNSELGETFEFKHF